MIIYLAVIDSSEGRHKFELIYDRYKNLIFYTVSKILGNARDSGNTVYDAFLEIIEITSDIMDVECPQTKSLVVTIAGNKAIDLHRKRRKQEITPFEEKHPGVLDRSEPDNIEDGEVLARAVTSLPGKYREVPFLKYSHGYSVDEIALILSMSKKNVGKTIRQTGKKLE